MRRFKLPIAIPLFLALILLACQALATDDAAKLTAEIERLVKGQQTKDLHVPNNDAVKQHLKRITENERLGMEKTLARAPVYRSFIESKIVQKQMPAGLIAVVMQESAFKPAAVSRTGAAGLWQFKPATARLFKLRYDAFVDERFDAEAATDAALKYLGELHEQFNDWSLALAAYNWGRGSVARTMESTGITNFWAMCKAGKVRAETAGYVPGIFARLLVWRDPTRYGFEPVVAQKLETFVLPPLSDLNAVEAACGIEGGKLQKLNPQLLTDYTPPYRDNRRVFVTTEMKDCLENLKETGTLNKLVGKPGKLRGVKLVRHRVKKGDTVWGISRNYGSCVESILDYNGWQSAPALSSGMTVLVYKKVD